MRKRGPPLPSISEGFHRLSSKEFDPHDIGLHTHGLATSPSHATKLPPVSFGLDVHRGEGYRRRAHSESITTRSHELPEVPSLETFRTKMGTVMVALPERDVEGVREDKYGVGTKEMREREESEAIGRHGGEEERKSEEEQSLEASGTVPPQKEDKQEEGSTTEDFARNVRGTSTPISEESPTHETQPDLPHTSQTFDNSSTSAVVMETEEGDTEIEERDKVKVHPSLEGCHGDQVV